MKDTRTEVFRLLDEGIADDQRIVRNFKVVDPYDGPHAARYRKIKELLKGLSPQGGE